MASVGTQNSLNGIRPGDTGSKPGHLSREVIGCVSETRRHAAKVGPGTVSDALPKQLCGQLKCLEDSSSKNMQDRALTVDSKNVIVNQSDGLKAIDLNFKGHNTANRLPRSKRQSLHYPSKNAGPIKKRRRTVEKIVPTKFLLGGNFHDPLNLNSLTNEIDEKTPATSPLPHLNKDPDPVIIPRDITDPLKLNSVSSEDDEPQLTTTIFSRKLSSAKKRKRVSRGEKKEDESELCDRTKRRMLELNLDTAVKINIVPDRNLDKIVSPVLPETVKGRKRKRVEPTNKLSKALLIESDHVKERTVTGTDIKRRKISPEKSKYRRQSSKDNQSKQAPKFKSQNKKFQYGNYTRYYGYRNPEDEDVRLGLFRKEWFEGKVCLDIGCNTGHVTLYVAKNFAPVKITGIDIDGNLIGMARKNIKHCLLIERDAKTKEGGQFPTAMATSFGHVKDLPKESVGVASSFPANVMFRCANFVLEKDEHLSTQKPEYDMVLCLSMTKWVHLNWGDSGLKRMFKRIFLALRPGGQLILEPQAWSSYCKKKKVTETTYKNFFQLQLRPEQFKNYLLREVGFIKCECLGTPLNPSKGFRRPLLMFTKAKQGQDESDQDASTSARK
ncbi:probable RNA methyltransferase Y17G7B.18 [Anneissia japonica]|uniref:probable RNA methyltransferase Y17G7B.18 n=1 Tax=Anneissia japonica TaxID=1529436 RepID=UPI001425614F|nr:probable RNA methyltransferase Y17G7B.18 [Anneissia japonica]XP_033103892.1 probable RNA methyltransferase Y17G7B.18 [Anneissia japonica]